MKTNVKMFYNLITKLDAHSYLKNYLIYHLSPVIKGVKPAITLSISKKKELYNAWLEIGEQLLASLDLKFTLLREASTSIILYIYDTNQLSEVIHNEEVAIFLQRVGYKQNTNVNEAIDMLVERYALYNCPHELGVFLGIPLKDVVDFMHCSDKPCILCGYWQVYNDVDEAIAIFAQYDKAKNDILCDLLQELKATS